MIALSHKLYMVRVFLQNLMRNAVKSRVSESQQTVLSLKTEYLMQKYHDNSVVIFFFFSKHRTKKIRKAIDNF